MCLFFPRSIEDRPILFLLLLRYFSLSSPHFLLPSLSPLSPLPVSEPQRKEEEEEEEEDRGKGTLASAGKRDETGITATQAAKPN